MKLTQELLKEFLWYNPVLGTFTWIKAPSMRVDVGSRAGRMDEAGYWMLGLFGKQYRYHRLAFFYMTGRWPDQVDHMNGDRSDNRWDNLREVTHQQNNWNRGAYRNSKTGIKGVMSSGKKFKVMLRCDGKSKYCGTYETLELAAEASDLLQEMIQGEYKYGSISSP